MLQNNNCSDTISVFTTETKRCVLLFLRRATRRLAGRRPTSNWTSWGRGPTPPSSKDTASECVRRMQVGVIVSIVGSCKSVFTNFHVGAAVGTSLGVSATVGVGAGMSGNIFLM